MEIKLKFMGAAKNVTGSRYLLETNGKKLLIDCGMHQERDFKDRDYQEFPILPSSIDAVVLTHAHLDHCGYLPKLVKEGFQGKIYCSAPTAEIAQIVMLDSGHIQEEDAKRKIKRHKKEGKKSKYEIKPLYTAEDAYNVLPLFHTVAFDEVFELAEGLTFELHENGHILGASAIKFVITQNGESRSLVFSGDVGRWDKPIIRDPVLFDDTDYLIIESTYGNRVHEKTENIEEVLCEIVNNTKMEGGNIIIPSFSVERSHEVLYHLNQLLLKNKIPHLFVFLDSPMARRVTDVFKNHPEMFDKDMVELLKKGESPFDFAGLKMVRTQAESKNINSLKGTAIIIAGSGMCTGGRVKHHLVHNIGRPESTILFVGYQAHGTLGRQIVDGAEEVRLFGKYFKVKAKVAQIHGFSAHADRNELIRWASDLKQPPRHIFVTHGETEAAESFAELLKEKVSQDVSTPEYLDEVTLD